MRPFLIIALVLCMFGCANQKGMEIKPEVIAYRFTGKVEQLLLKQIEEHPKDNYCLLISEEDNLRQIILVTGYSYFHKNTSYYALIGRKYYPISFPQFDMKYGVTENAEELLQRKIDNEGSDDFITPRSYPMYHGMYKIELDSKNNVVFEGYVY
jgi:hypothetical protein